MEQFTPKNIALLLIVLGILWYGMQEFFAWCRRNDEQWAARNPAPDSDERQQEIAAEHVRKRTFPQQHYYRYADGIETEGGHRD